jgi:hypothetical protein
VRPNPEERGEEGAVPGRVETDDDLAARQMAGEAPAREEGVGGEHIAGIVVEGPYEVVRCDEGDVEDADEQGDPDPHLGAAPPAAGA